MSRLAAAVVGVAIVLGACAVHEPYSFRGATIIIDRGISIPVPPPSLSDEPVQETEVEGDVDFELAGQGGAATLHVRDRVSEERSSTIVQQPADSFLFEGLLIDHSDNCLELWLESGAHKTPVTLYHTVIAADDQSVEVVEGCP